MRYLKFHIKNYKGIEDLVIDFDEKPDYRIYALVGLNESGKSTILEAINDSEFAKPIENRHELIPKRQAGGFTGNTTIKATVELADTDRARIADFLQQDLKLRFNDLKIDDKITLTRTYKFENSVPVPLGSSHVYNYFIHIKKTSRSPNHVLLDAETSKKVWTFIDEKLYPEIIFYKDFLSKLPEKIYLDSTVDVKEKEYIDIVKDILVSINPTYSLEENIINRLKTKSAANTQALEAVENELGAKISQVVFTAWSRIQRVSKKEIVVKAGLDEDRPYVKLIVKDGLQSYAISERSLGFRWFFTFLLYTEFRKERIKTSGEILFLLDEPASNLHQAAQKSLLQTFENIATKARLVYTTHSHHLINPKWLGNAYVIRNKALQYVEDDNFSIRNTEVEAHKYKEFASAYPNQTSYFQPILDVLDYQPGLLEQVPNIVITEGKFDYSTFRFFNEIILKDKKRKITFYPGHGATKLDLPIALYEAWARPYLTLLDGDKQGKSEQVRYIKELSSAEKIYTLQDIDASFRNIATEDLFTESEKLKISQEYSASLTKYDKSAFNTGIQILWAENRIPSYLSPGTIQKFESIMDFLSARLT